VLSTRSSFLRSPQYIRNLRDTTISRRHRARAKEKGAFPLDGRSALPRLIALGRFSRITGHQLILPSFHDHGRKERSVGRDERKCRR
jgi:hypothetical protein